MVEKRARTLFKLVAKPTVVTLEDPAIADGHRLCARRPGEKRFAWAYRVTVARVAPRLLPTPRATAAIMCCPLVC